MSLLADLQEFVGGHHSHGPLTADATEPAWNGYLLTVACPVGRYSSCWITPWGAELDLLRAASLNYLCRSATPK